MTLLEAKQLALQIIEGFPKSKNGQPFLKCKSGEKIFFKIFSKKYGLYNEIVKYKELDIQRRIRMIEAFPYFLKSYEIQFDSFKNGQNYYILESLFFTFVVIQTTNKQYELLSFYPK